MKASELPNWIKWAGLFVGIGLAGRGAIEFIQEAPAVVSANAGHIEAHHDSIVDLSEASAALQAHVLEQETANEVLVETLGEMKRQTDYLTCWRGERERQRDNPDAPPSRDCEQELLEGSGR